MSNQRTYVTDILGNYHDRSECRTGADSILTDREYEYLYRAGLGPIANQVLVDPHKTPASESHKMLRSADLTTRVIYRETYNAICEILKQAAAQKILVVLLKGVSISAELYEPPHHRLMRDVDILVREDDVSKLRAILVGLGYESGPPDASPKFPEQHHHLPEVVHPATGIVIEVHTRLISHKKLAQEPIFQPSVFLTQVRQSKFADYPCGRFSPEYQFVYTIGHWANDGKWAVNVTSINDILHLLLRSERDLHWDVLGKWMTENPLTGDCITVIMSYLADCRLIDLPEEISEQLSVSVRRIGRSNMKILHWLLHKFPMSGSTKVGWAVTRRNARIAWLTLLEPRSRFLRLLVAIFRIVFKRVRGKSLLESIAFRLRTLIQPNN